ncbi:MAG TPA: GAP family protein, partial [Thermoleophilaceae bacterium]|nr:GAP family protein [Thermoleophilaceae bacterium]
GSLLAQVVPLAAGAAISPGLLALQMLNLSRPSGGMARAWSVLAGAAAVVAVVSVASLFVTVGLGDLGRDEKLRAVVRLVAAVVLVGVAVYELLHPTRPDAGAPAAPGGDDRRRGRIYVTSAGLGAGLVAPNMALYLPAAHEIARSTVSAPGKLAAFLVAGAVALTPVAGPPLAVTVLGDRVRPALEALNGFVTRNSRVVTIVACLVFAVYLTITGIVGLQG